MPGWGGQQKRCSIAKRRPSLAAWAWWSWSARAASSSRCPASAARRKAPVGCRSRRPIRLSRGRPPLNTSENSASYTPSPLGNTGLACAHRSQTRSRVRWPISTSAPFHADEGIRAGADLGARGDVDEARGGGGETGAGGGVVNLGEGGARGAVQIGHRSTGWTRGEDKNSDGAKQEMVVIHKRQISATSLSGPIIVVTQKSNKCRRLFKTGQFVRG